MEQSQLKNTKIVNLGQVRGLLTEWDKVRQHFLSQNVTGFQISLLGDSGRETVYVGGIYKEDPQKALKATLRISAARALTEDEPLEFDPPEFANSHF